MYSIGQVAEMFGLPISTLRYYDKQAIQDGSEDRLKALIPDRLPDMIRKAYENAHC
ncbi:MerR family DNA-binding transcriptional regulator [Agathobaculum sp.]|uniref:MerR family DNA-binding transcriptional regulator n=1 Tax=Agathobaculum sp. TaxID=2048138 RepID=UPI003AEFF476